MATSIDQLRSAYDVVIVGGRVAGAATALLLARAGVSVALIERGWRGADTLSTLALMRCGVLQLSRWGLVDALIAAGTPPITTTSFHYDGEPVEIPIKARDGVNALLAPRRTVIDPLLADSAQSAGADVAYGVRVRELLRNGDGRVAGVVCERGGRTHSISSSLVIGADGVRSVVAARVGANPYRVGVNASGVIYTVVPGLALAGYQWHYRTGASVGVIPTSNGDTVVFAAVPQQRFMEELRRDLRGGFNAVLRDVSPALADAIGSSTSTVVHGFAGQRGFLRPAAGPGWALVGDAGYFKDPITAHGITDALRDAEDLARAVLDGTDEALAAYQSVRDDLSLRLFDITDEIASYAWDVARLRVLHRALSQEMGREVSHVLASALPSRPFAAC